MKPTDLTTVALLAIILLSGMGLQPIRVAATQTSESLSMSLSGGVVSAGNQNYTIVQNGPALEAVINGSSLVSSYLTYTLNAWQQGLSTSGNATFHLKGQNSTGGNVTVDGKIQISASIPAVCLPSGN